MIPAPGKTLADLALRIMTDLAPELGSNFAQADAGLIAGLLLTMAQKMGVESERFGDSNRSLNLG